MYSYFEVENRMFDEFYLMFCGRQQCVSNYSYGPAIREHYLIHYCLKGKGYYHYQNKIYPIKAGEAFIIFPNEVTFYQADKDDPWEYTWIGFGGKNAKLYLEHCHLTQENVVVQCKYMKELENCLEQMLYHHQLSYSNELMLQGYLYQFFAYLAKSANLTYHSEVENENIYVSKAIEYIQNNYQNPVTVELLANFVGIHRSYLSTLFEQHLQLSPQQFLLKYRITKAKNMLINTDISIQQVAASIGYANQLSFSKAFKKVVGISPSFYRQKQQIKPNSLYLKEY